MLNAVRARQRQLNAFPVSRTQHVRGWRIAGHLQLGDTLPQRGQHRRAVGLRLNARRAIDVRQNLCLDGGLQPVVQLGVEELLEAGVVDQPVSKVDFVDLLARLTTAHVSDARRLACPHSRLGCDGILQRHESRTRRSGGSERTGAECPAERRIVGVRCEGRGVIAYKNTFGLYNLHVDNGFRFPFPVLPDSR